MGKEGRRERLGEEEEAGATKSRNGGDLCRRKSKSRTNSSSEDDSSSADSEDRRKSSGKRAKRHKRPRRRYSDDDSDEDSASEGSDSESEYSSEESEEHRRRKRKERRRREREEKRGRRKRKEKEKKRKKERDEEEKKRKKKKHQKQTGAVTNSWGKFGIIRETDMWNKRPEFTAWLAEVKQINLEHMPNWEEKQMFKQFMEDHNTATFPSKKYYDLDAYHVRKLEKQQKRGLKKVNETERTVFDDEEQRRQELLLERAKRKEEEVKVLKRSMESGMAKAMKEQAQLREEMAYQYKLGNFEAAAAIQRRLDPDLAM